MHTIIGVHTGGGLVVHLFLLLLLLLLLCLHFSKVTFSLMCIPIKTSIFWEEKKSATHMRPSYPLYS